MTTIASAAKIRSLEMQERQLQNKIVELKRAYQVLGEDLARAQERVDRLESAIRRLLANISTYGVVVAHEDVARALGAVLAESTG